MATVLRPDFTGYHQVGSPHVAPSLSPDVPQLSPSAPRSGLTTPQLCPAWVNKVKPGLTPTDPQVAQQDQPELAAEWKPTPNPYQHPALQPKAPKLDLFDLLCGLLSLPLPDMGNQPHPRPGQRPSKQAQPVPKPGHAAMFKPAPKVKPVLQPKPELKPGATGKKPTNELQVQLISKPVPAVVLQPVVVQVPESRPPAPEGSGYSPSPCVTACT